MEQLQGVSLYGQGQSLGGAYDNWNSNTTSSKSQEIKQKRETGSKPTSEDIPHKKLAGSSKPNTRTGSLVSQPNWPKNVSQ